MIYPIYQILKFLRYFSFKNRQGGVTEWLKVPLSKSGVISDDRGFESHPLRQKISRRVLENAL